MTTTEQRMAQDTPVAPRPMRAPRGTTLTCKGWPQEAAYRMLQNNLDPEVAERPDELVVYGGRGRAARSWPALLKILEMLRELEGDETLLVQSGKPVGVFRTTPDAPRVLLANSLLVPAWATRESFDRLEAAGLTMYGQMTAGSWIYIGTQGILQGTYETFAQAAQQHFGGSLAGRLVVTAGLGGMGGAQPLAVTMNEGVALCVEVDPTRIQRRIETRYLDVAADSLDEALALADAALRERRPLSIGLLGNAAAVIPQLAQMGRVPAMLTDQTSAHDPLHGYIPLGLSLDEAAALRQSDPEGYVARSLASMATHVRGMLDLQRQGAITFDYGNNIRQQAYSQGVSDAFAFPGFVPAYIRPLFCEGYGPFRWVALSGNPADIGKIDDMVLREFGGREAVRRWIALARERVAFQGLPARICWLGYGERANFGQMVNGIHQLIAPDIFMSEVSNGLVTAERRGRIKTGESKSLLLDVLRAAPVVHLSTPYLLRAMELAIAHRRAVYDCVYLALAEAEGCELITADDQFALGLQTACPFIVRLVTLP